MLRRVLFRLHIHGLWCLLNAFVFSFGLSDSLENLVSIKALYCSNSKYHSRKQLMWRCTKSSPPINEPLPCLQCSLLTRKQSLRKIEARSKREVATLQRPFFNQVHNNQPMSIFSTHLVRQAGETNPGPWFCAMEPIHKNMSCKEGIHPSSC